MVSLEEENKRLKEQLSKALIDVRKTKEMLKTIVTVLNKHIKEI